ncbi:MAG: hypothetical protein O2960_02750 [Verrucomicrobia bacterium]|nr:hypothetical protein [Verrucomicrobiota bacterium]
MLVIDESISENEVWRLREWRIAVRVIGEDLADKSISDENILSLLHRLKHPTFFTRDRDFWKAELSHPRYALVFMDIPEHEGLVATHIRRFLRHPSFNSNLKRLGKVIHVHQTGIELWHGGAQSKRFHEWESKV